MNVIRVTGTYGFRDSSPEATMADMLRYDDGEMISFETFPIEGIRSSKKFVAEVHANDFTPQRWLSFGLRAELLRKEPGKAICTFPDMDSVQKFIHNS